MTSTMRLLPVIRLATTSRHQLWRAGARRGFTTRSSLLVKKYTENHEWIELDNSGKIGTIGISEYAAKALGDVVYVELPAKGLEVKQKDAFGAVESVKSASDIYAPVTGTVIETNAELEAKPGTINKEPEGNGWIAKMELTDASQVEKLMSKQDYNSLEKD